PAGVSLVCSQHVQGDRGDSLPPGRADFRTPVRNMTAMRTAFWPALILLLGFAPAARGIGDPQPNHRGGLVDVFTQDSIYISPDVASLVVGDTLTFSASGSVVPPLTWATTDSYAAGIDANGLLTALHGGTCRVIVDDAGGARDTTGTISVADLT